MKDCKAVLNFSNANTLCDCCNDWKNDELNLLRDWVIKDSFRRPAMRKEDFFPLDGLIDDITLLN